ncbi:hypothetical protein [uncultured Chryseobacterium sp.]|uniref:hypothetical protein n=1 Tax=uncultured Chryseobacterium sp. TaxID=259322 RepID=UPI0025CFD81B|nr:hypothetical protein [uncultured Chryseobacterium sp.]
MLKNINLKLLLNKLFLFPAKPFIRCTKTFSSKKKDSDLVFLSYTGSPHTTFTLYLPESLLAIFVRIKEVDVSSG